MNPSPSHRLRGSAFITVMLFTSLLLVIVASLLQWSLTERRINMRNAYWLEARNAAEAASQYAFAQLYDRYELRNPQGAEFSPSGTTPVVPPSSSLWQYHTSGNVDPSSVEVVVGPPQDVPSDGSMFFVDPVNFPNDPLRGEYVYRRDVTVLAKATVRPPNFSPITDYVVETFSVFGAPLFAHALFYNSTDLEVFPGPTMWVYGPVHCNGNIFVSSQGSSLNFFGPVSCTGNIYHAWADSNSAAQGTGGETLNSTSPVYFWNGTGTAAVFSGSTQNMFNMQVGSIWKDSTNGTDSGVSGLSNLIPLVTATNTDAFRTFTSGTLANLLQTSANGVQSYSPVGFSEQVDDNGGTPAIPVYADPHSLIDPPATNAYLHPSGADAVYTDARQSVESQKYSTESSLYVLVKLTAPSSGNGQPSYTVQYYGPAGSAAAAGVTDPLKIGPNGGVLLNAPAAGANTLININRFQSTTVSVGAMITSGTNKNKYPVTTTVTTSTGAMTPVVTYSSTNPGNSTTVNAGMYDQRRSMGIDLVEVDMGWQNASGANTAAGLKAVLVDTISNTNANDSSSHAFTYSDSGGTKHVWNNSYAPSLTGDPAAAAWNGAVYVDVQALTSSGNPLTNPTTQSASVRLKNAQVPSGSSLIPSPPSNPGSGYGANGLGLTVATNAPLYFLGNFNANGGTPQTDSARTPDDGHTGANGDASVESPICVAADAITILSPSWSDATSQTSVKPTAATNTEIAAAFLTGNVPTGNGNANGVYASSGGVHNLPRFLESFSSKTVTIRGAIAAMFPCKIARQKWTTAYYDPPNRNWGFDRIFQNGNYPPFTPRVLSYRSHSFSDLSAGDQVVSGVTVKGYNHQRHDQWPSYYSYP